MHHNISSLVVSSLSRFSLLNLSLLILIMVVLSAPLGPAVCTNDAKALEFIEEMTTDCDSVQTRVLGEILGRNGDTEYLRQFRLEGATDRDTFKAKVPVVAYEDLQPLIQRIANGDRSPILSSHPISEFLTR